VIFSHKLPSPPLASEHALISCPLCKKAGRGDFPHYQSECTYLPDTDRKFIAKAGQIVDILDCDESDREEEAQEYQPAPTWNQPTPGALSTPSALRIRVRQSPYLDTFYRRNSYVHYFYTVHSFIKF